MHSELAGFPVRIEIPVAWGDMDALGHANNIRYFRWFEDARFAAFRESGISAHLEGTGIGPILARTTCVFRSPVTYPDTILAGARIADIGADRFTVVHRLVSRAQDAIVAEGDARIVMVDYRRGGKSPLSAELRSALERQIGDPSPG
jgi:acyl-CoA thioester hydrolase